MADPYRAPMPFGGGNDAAAPLALHVAPVHPAVKPESETITHAVIKIRADAAAALHKRPKLSAILTLDVSGSMLGEPLAQVVHSAQRLAEILDDGDRLGVVTFADGAHSVAPLHPLGQARRDVIAKLSQIAANGRTNISGGLAQAALMFPRREPGERQLVVLMSDGDPNVGAVTAADLGAAARLLKDREIAVSTLGFGAKHNDEVLAAIAEGAGGRYTFVVDPKLAEASFIRALGAQLDVVAERVELLLSPGENVEIIRLLEDPPAAFGAGGLRVTLSDLVAGDELNVVVELRLRAPRETGMFRMLTATLSCNAAGTARSFKTTAHVEPLVTRGDGLASDPVAHALVSVALAAEMRTKARSLSDRGSYGDAEALLRKAQALIAATPGFAKGDGGALDDAFETLADEILVMARRPDREAYENYKRAARDHADFAVSGASVRGGAKLSEAPPSSRMLLDRARAGAALPRAFLRVLSGPRAGLRLAITKERFVIGRSTSACDLLIGDANISRQHSIIELIDGAFWLVDMGSTTGVRHNGQRVARLPLADGIEFEVGDSTIRYETS